MKPLLLPFWNVLGQVNGIDVNSVTSPQAYSPLTTWIADCGTLSRIAPTPEGVGVILEFEDDFDFDQMLQSPFRPYCEKDEAHGTPPLTAIEHSVVSPVLLNIFPVYSEPEL